MKSAYGPAREALLSLTLFSTLFLCRFLRDAAVTTNAHAAEKVALQIKACHQIPGLCTCESV